MNISSPEHIHNEHDISPSNRQEKHEVYEPKFLQIKEDLQNLFNIEITSETSLSYPWVKDELFAKVIEDFQAGKPFALDYMFEEGLLTAQDLKERNIQQVRPQAMIILATLKGPRLIRVKDMFVATGIMTKEETESIPNN